MAGSDRPPPPGEAGRLIADLGLAPHPEGGWFRETWRSPAARGARAASTSILFLLPAGETSRWHKVDADEIWLHHAGAPLALATAGPAGVAVATIGADPVRGETLQAVVPAGVWQAAKPLGPWSLVACVVAPGFEFAGFTLAAPGWSPEGAEDFLPSE